MSSLVAHKRRLQGHTQNGGVFTNVDLRSAQCFQSAWGAVTFEGSRLSLVNFVNSRWQNCHLVGSTVYGSSFNTATLEGVIFENCDMEQATFAAAVVRDCTFKDCRLAYSSFVNATLHDVVFDNCNLHGATLLYAAATGVTYARSNLWSAEIQLGCTFFNSAFGVDDCKRFAALLARVHPDPKAKAQLIEIAGDLTYKAVERLMRP